jgi:hypothetical protein
MGNKKIKYEMPALKIVNTVQNLCVGGSHPSLLIICTAGQDVHVDDCISNGVGANADPGYCTNNGIGAQAMKCEVGTDAGFACAAVGGVAD